MDPFYSGVIVEQTQVGQTTGVAPNTIYLLHKGTGIRRLLCTLQ